MVSAFVFILTVVYCVSLVVFSVGEWKSLHIPFICIGVAVHAKLFFQCALDFLHIHRAMN